MKHAAPLVRRSSLQLAGVLISAGALAVAACAEAPVDDDPGGAVSETNNAETEESSSVLPPSNPPAPAKDAGTTATKDSGTTQKDAGTTPPPAPDSGSSGGISGGSCDPNDFLYVIKALDEVGKASPRTCGLSGGTCKSTECCFDVYSVCVDL